MQESTVEIPDEFMCPISSAIMSNPVLAEDGETYEKEAIEKYFASKKTNTPSAQDNTKAVQKKGEQPVKITSPLHGTEMGTKLTPNLGILRQIKRFLESNPSAAKEAYFEEGLITEALKTIQLGDANSLRRLIEKDKRLLEKETSEGKNLIEAVCQEGTPELLSVVLTALRKANTNTPLFSDAKSKILLLLCVKSMQKNGFDAFIKGCEWATQQTEEFYTTQIKEGCTELVKAFVQYGIIDIDYPLDHQKNTALHLAVLSNQSETVKLLIELGANSKIPNQEGLDIKQLAQKRNDHKLVRDISQWRHDKKSAPLREEVQRLQRENAELKSTVALLVEHRQRKDRLLAERQAAEQEAARIASLAPNSRVNQKARSVSGCVAQEAVTELFNYTVRGQLNEVRECLRRNRDLVHVQGDITDLSNRTFPMTTGFQYAVWSGDEELWNVYLEFLSEADAYDQLMELLNERSDITRRYGSPLSFFDPLLAAYARYKASTTQENWCRGVGGAQRNMPAWFIYVFSEEGYGSWPTKQMTRSFSRKSEHVKAWFEEEYDNDKCGSTFAFFRGVGPRRNWMVLLSLGEYGAHDLENSATLKTECTKKLVVLRERLERASKKTSSVSPMMNRK